MNIFTKRIQIRKQKRLKRKSLETERIKAQHGLDYNGERIGMLHNDDIR